MSVALHQRPAAVPTGGDSGPRPLLIDPILDTAPLPPGRRRATTTSDPHSRLGRLSARARTRRRASIAALAVPVIACLILSTPIQDRQMQLP